MTSASGIFRKLFPESKFVNGDHLTAFVISTTRTGDVRGGCASTFGAHIELPRAPALAGATEALFHFRSFTFRDCHSELRVLRSAHLTGKRGDVNEGILLKVEKSYIVCE